MSIPAADLKTFQKMVGKRYQPLALLGQQAGRKTLLAKDVKLKCTVVIKLLLFGEGFS